jgi:hypothetical protein
MKNLISTIQKELNSNSLYLNHCNSEIQLLRSLKGLALILKLKPLNSLKRVLNELLTTKEKYFMVKFEKIAAEEEYQELSPDFEKANLQFITTFEEDICREKESH